jgi:hypothetical protein
MGMMDFLFGDNETTLEEKQKKAEKLAKPLGAPAKTVINQRDKLRNQLDMLRKEMGGKPRKEKGLADSLTKGK